jgi:hypothetical protein
MPSGRVDFELGNHYTPVTYYFRGEAESHPPEGQTRTPDWNGVCQVAVDVGPDSVARATTGDSPCTETLAGKICSLADVWKRAAARGVSADQAAFINYSGRGDWLFAVGDTSFTVSCP